VTDLDRVKLLVRDLYTELGLDAPPKKGKPVEVRYEDGPNGMFVVDLDKDGKEVGRQFVPSRTITRGMKTTED